MDLKKLANAFMGAGQSKIYRVGCQAKIQARVDVIILTPKAVSLEAEFLPIPGILVFFLKVFS